MSVLHILFAAMARSGELRAGNGGTTTANDGVSPYDSNVSIRFKNDGTVDTGTSINGGAISYSSHGTWFFPTDVLNTPGNYSVRYTNHTSAGGHDFTAKAAAEDAWVALGSLRVWTWNETSATLLAENSFACDFEVRDDVGGLTTATVSYTFKIDNSA